MNPPTILSLTISLGLVWIAFGEYRARQASQPTPKNDIADQSWPIATVLLTSLLGANLTIWLPTFLHW